MRRIHNVFHLWTALAVRLLLLGVTMAVWPSAVHADAEASSDVPVTFTLSIKTSPSAKYETSETYDRADWRRAWTKAKTAELAEPSSVYTDTYIEVADEGGKRQYAMRADGVLFEAATGKTVTLSVKVRKTWRTNAAKLRKRHYGEIVDWDEAKSRLPLKAVVAVVDMETGLSFRAQRRAGSSHADVQPLTREDTAVMKQIYGGTWSWKRRAIVVVPEDGEQRVAASMHGMPHGGDGIPDNGFSGHFCIHFRGSATHGSGKTDLSHQLMVYKAAGRLSELYQAATPEQLAEYVFDALHQQDEAVLRAALQGTPSETLQTFLTWFAKIDALRIASMKPGDPHDGQVTAEVPLKVVWNGRGGGVRLESVRLLFVRENAHSPWVVTSFETGKK
ncbi:hypothetical protein [Paenibacillus ginsengarvi]|uniref:Uncharacterized protein n=1 Tax=Paenibacillus ginsengarvi TaxID=400777 RepID=A0A3B0C3P2_9BACL|nr:hypothetical protein [Paenibacillus ginsengarvi]RKN78994.1 hypothetical protein D7M11_21725 [Paenibacillus ginsengarvi]